MRAALRDGRWDIVLSDYSMPQFSGPEALRVWRECAPDLPFVVVSGAVGEHVVIEMMKAGASDYVMKGNLIRLPSVAQRELQEAGLRRQRKRAEEQLRKQARYYAALAGFGQRALSAVDIAALLDDAVTLVAETLEVELSKVLRFLPEEEQPRLEAGVGWGEGLVGHATVCGGANSQAGFTLLSNQPVIVDDLRTETRFTGPKILHTHGAVSGVSVVLRGTDRPFGVLSAHSRTRREFTPDDAHFLQTIADLLGQTIQRHEAEDRLRLVLEQMPAVLWATDGDLSVTSALGSGLARLKVTAEQFSGVLQAHLREEGSDAPTRAAHRRALRGEAVDYKTTVLGRTFHAHIEPLRDRASNIVGVVGVADDITERLRCGSHAAR